MSTKNDPGDFDVYVKLEPDEPYFILRARDMEAPVAIHVWVHLWLREIQMGLRPESDRAQIAEAMKCAAEMEQWGREYQNRKSREGMEFDDRGIPLTGPHRHIANASTSGANDGA